jgi:hypothetical protein
MSNASPLPINKVLVVDPLCDQQVESVYAVEKSASIQNFYNIASNNKSSTSITYVINCNSETTLTDRVWMQDIKARFSITMNDAAKKPPDNGICLRPYALSQVATSVVLQQGNSSTSIQSSQISSALQRYGFYDKYLNYSQSNPSLDMTTPYLADQPPFTNDLVGNKYQERFATSQLLSATWADEVLTLTVRFLEPIFISPLLSSLHIRREAMRKISQYQLTLNMGEWARAFSIAQTEDAGCFVTGIKCEEIESATLNLLQAIPSPLDVGRNLTTQILPYNEFISFNTDPKTLAYCTANNQVGASQPFESAVIQVSRVPEAIYLYCRPTDAFMKSPHATDTFATYVTNTLAINFNGVNQFQNCSALSLYRICRQNSCNIPWPQWSTTGLESFNFSGAAPKPVYDSGVGSVICLKLSKDITLDSSLAPSTNVKLNMQISCSFATSIEKSAIDQPPYGGVNAATGIPHSFYVVIEYAGVQETYASNSVATSIGVLSTEDVLTATKRNERVHYSVIDDGEVYGGASWMDKAKKFLTEGKLVAALKQLKSYFSHPLTKEIGKTAKEYLRGRDDAEKGSNQFADALDEIGLGMSGGRKMTKAQLRQALLR